MTVSQKFRVWEKYPDLPDGPAAMKESLQKRMRHKQTRYLLFRLRTEVEKHGGVIPNKLDGIDLPPGFVDHFLTAEIRCVELPTGQQAEIVGGRIRTPSEIGGFGTFASRWDVDVDLNVYSRHRSVWQEWDGVISRVAPILEETG